MTMGLFSSTAPAEVGQTYPLPPNVNDPCPKCGVSCLRPGGCNCPDC